MHCWVHGDGVVDFTVRQRNQFPDIRTRISKLQQRPGRTYSRKIQPCQRLWYPMHLSMHQFPEIIPPIQLKGWIVNGTNLINTMPDQANTLKAIQNLDLLVAIDTMPMEITGWADVVLPECTYLERYDCLRISPHRKPALALRMPAAEPMYDSKPGYWIARELSKKLGLEAYFPVEKQEDLLDWQLKQIGSSLEEMKKHGSKNL